MQLPLPQGHSLEVEEHLPAARTGESGLNTQTL